MDQLEMLENITKLFNSLDELMDYGLYSHDEVFEIKYQTIINFNRIWDLER